MANPRIDWIFYSDPHSTPNRNPDPSSNVHSTGHPNSHATLNPSRQNHLHDYHRSWHHYSWLIQRIFQLRHKMALWSIVFQQLQYIENFNLLLLLMLYISTYFEIQN